MRRMARMYPAFRGVGVAESWAGMIEATPDALPVLDAAGPEGYYIATGFSGHGFGMGPGAGLLMAELVAGRAPRVDLSPFRLSRFRDGTPLKPYSAI